MGLLANVIVLIISRVGCGRSCCEYDIEKNARAKRHYDALGGKGVPVILMGKKRMNGFSPQGFDRMYKS
ncbi:MAG: hypothetical protein ACI9NY_000763 [Kiritimatiellia bacterium]|jgi:hypothetical protein